MKTRDCLKYFVNDCRIDIFQETSFCTLVSSTNLVLKVVLNEAGQYLCRVFSFMYLKLIVF